MSDKDASAFTLLEAAGWQRLAAHDYRAAHLFYALLARCQPENINWALGECMALLKSGRRAEAQAVAARIAAERCTAQQWQSLHRLRILTAVGGEKAANENDRPK